MREQLPRFRVADAPSGKHGSGRSAGLAAGLRRGGLFRRRLGVRRRQVCRRRFGGFRGGGRFHRGLLRARRRSVGSARRRRLVAAGRGGPAFRFISGGDGRAHCRPRGFFFRGLAADHGGYGVFRGGGDLRRLSPGNFRRREQTENGRRQPDRAEHREADRGGDADHGQSLTYSFSAGGDPGGDGGKLFRFPQISVVDPRDGVQQNPAVHEKAPFRYFFSFLLVRIRIVRTYPSLIP